MTLDAKSPAFLSLPKDRRACGTAPPYLGTAQKLPPFPSIFLTSNTVDLKDIKKIVELMNEHELSYFHLEKEEFNLKLKKGADPDTVQPLMMHSPAAAPAPAPAAPAAAPAAAAPAEAAGSGDEEITSPMVGTFYTKPAPDAASFVKVGDTVSKGQTLCIIEAMKVMNEIEAEVSGTITTILVEDGTPVQFGDPLFTIK